MKRAVEIATGEEHVVLHDYAMPKAIGSDCSIMRPAIEAHNFELKPVLVTFVERDQLRAKPLFIFFKG